MGRLKWVDGLRGIAAAIVAFDHFFMSDVWHPFISFWTEPPEGNRHLVQLPPLRILFAAHGMVTLFMVISGYAISISLLKARSSPQFLERMSSAIVRRVFRIYLPVLVTASLAQFLYFFNLFHWKFDEEFLGRLPQPWTAPWAHVKVVMSFMADSINIIAFVYRGCLNGQLWTMPMEFRGSNVVYLLIIGLSSWRQKPRFYILPITATFFLWYGNWDVFGFIWGLWLAERAATSSVSSSDLNTEMEMGEYEDRPHSLLTSSPSLSLWREKDWYSGLEMGKYLTLSHIGPAFTFVMGYYLLCLGLDGHLPPGYQFLSVFQPAHWANDWDISHMCWKSIGSAMLVYAIGELPCLQQPLNTRPAQYLGKISFALYLLHETIYQLWRDPLRDFVYLMVSGKEYGNSGEALNDPFSFHVAWWTTGVVLGPVVVYTAHYYTIFVDNSIFELAAADIQPRIVEVFWKNGKLCSKTPPPPLLHVCHISRQVLLKIYKPWLPRFKGTKAHQPYEKLVKRKELDSEHVYISLEHDILVLPGRCELGLIPRLHLRRLTFDLSGRVKTQGVKAFLTKFKSLRKVAFFDSKNDPTRLSYKINVIRECMDRFAAEQRQIDPNHVAPELVSASYLDLYDPAWLQLTAFESWEWMRYKYSDGFALPTVLPDLRLVRPQPRIAACNGYTVVKARLTISKKRDRDSDLVEENTGKRYRLGTATTTKPGRARPHKEAVDISGNSTGRANTQTPKKVKKHIELLDLSPHAQAAEPRGQPDALSSPIAKFNNPFDDWDDAPLSPIAKFKNPLDDWDDMPWSL
ncbi:uncharacterized protein LY89DRAFT_764994 [Mollisia scopiformis]|uniref:Acyltransferase 3 domain-containing protein n=1 Tax=Mollisia scopiformis TaxID=149040 RepID=A0A132B779_MOLSC|nr:uncharacterized protein LY89DRAFT_764994 [Mollisia scopiformis]KUJ08201.1 hypothetical protein LY89DRAFT_764994 [Mollisia scopiformis]